MTSAGERRTAAMTAEAAQAQAHFVPDVSHARREQVYEVSEDTLLLADSIEKDAALLHQLRPALCLEIGAGSGYVSAVLAHTLHAPALCFATDINAAAASATALTMRKKPPPHGLLFLLFLLTSPLPFCEVSSDCGDGCNHSTVWGRCSDGPGELL